MTTQRLLLPAFAALVLAGCTTKNQSSYLEILGVFPPVPNAPKAGVPDSCSPADTELSFIPVNPAQSQGVAYVNMTNTLASNVSVPDNRLNTNDFIAHQAVINYEVIGNGTLPQQIVPVSGVVPVTTTRKLSFTFFPLKGGAPTAPSTDGQTIRASFHIEGHLVDGSSVRTNEYEYLFVICTKDKCGGTCG